MAAGSVIITPEEMVAGATVKVTADNTVNTFVADASLTMLGTAPSARGGQRVVDAVLISVVTNNLRIGFGEITTVEGAAGLGHTLVAGDFLLIMGAANIRSFRYTNATANSHCIWMYTPFYAKN